MGRMESIEKTFIFLFLKEKLTSELLTAKGDD